MIYAGFWRRFGALWLDALILSPITALSIWMSGFFRLYFLYYLLPSLALGLFYSVFLVRHYGGTPGKLLAGLKIRRLDGSPVGYREALLRYMVEAVLTFAGMVALIFGVLKMTDEEYWALAYLARIKRIAALSPPWYRTVSLASQVWVWSEFLVMMTNRRRRALHDFIAGTVVIVDRPAENAQTASHPQEHLQPNDYPEGHVAVSGHAISQERDR